MQSFKLLVAACLLLGSWSSVQARDDSIRGLKAGMSMPEALQSLAADLRQGAKVTSLLEGTVLLRLVSKPGDPLLKTFTLRSGDEGCGWMQVTRHQGCLRLQATAWGTPQSSSRLYLIRLEEFFEQPLDFNAFAQRVKEAYGSPVVSIGTAAGGARNDYVRWLWSDEAMAQTPEVQKWAESGFKNGPVEIKFASPILHMQVYLRSGQVRGTEVVLLEPGLLRQFRSELDSWVKTQQDERTRKAPDDAGNVRSR